MSEYQAELSFERQQIQLKVQSLMHLLMASRASTSLYSIALKAGYDTRKIPTFLEELSKEIGISVEMADDLMEKLRKIRT